MYNAGHAFFTKAAFEHVIRQFDKYQGDNHEEGMVSIRTLDGKEVNFSVDTGKHYPFDYGDDDICVMYGVAQSILLSPAIY
jgi:hypothetical protein